MITGYVIYKGKQPLAWLADEDLRYRMNNDNLRVGLVFFDLSEAEKAMAEVPELFEFDDAKLSIREIKLPVIRIAGSATTDQEGPMLTISYAKLYEVLSGDDPESVDQASMDAVNALDLKAIVVDFSMSENHIGGDDVVSIVDQVLEAQTEGYRIATWYGPDAEVLVIGYRPGQLTLTADPVSPQ